MANRIIKIGMGFIGFIAAFLAIKQLFPEGTGIIEYPKGVDLVSIGICIIAFVIFYILTGIISKHASKIVDKVDSIIKSKTTSMYEFILGTIGLIGGLIIASFISIPILDIPFIGIPVTIIINILFAYIGFVIFLRNKNDRIFVRIRERLEESKDSASGKLLDTSVIIDGRIYDICHCGFIDGQLIVPDFVIDELKTLSDSADALKRARGHRGLDILASIQKEFKNKVKVEKYNKQVKDLPGVDEKLVEIAKKYSMTILTNDLNLNKVATIQDVSVLNINELSNALKPIVLVGEDINITIVKPGKEREQGIGYLDSGTMVVVEGTKKMLGETVTATVTSVIQTQAGRMIFANIKTE